MGVGFQSWSLTLEGEVTTLIRNITSSEINCKAGNSNRVIDNTVNIPLHKAPERCVPYLVEILCSSADLTASLFQWSKSIHIFQPRVMSGSFAWFQQLSNLSLGWQWSNMNFFFFFCKYLSGRVSFIFHCTKMFEDKLSSIVSYTVINMLLVHLPKFSRKTSSLPACPLLSDSCLHMSARIQYRKWQFVPKNSKKPLSSVIANLFLGQNWSPLTSMV